MKNIDIFESQKHEEKLSFDVRVVLIHITICIRFIQWKCCFCKKKITINIHLFKYFIG